MQLNVRWRRAPASLQATHPLGYNEDTLNHETGGCARFQREKKVEEEEEEEDGFHGCFSNSMYHPIVSRIFFIISLRTGDADFPGNARELSSGCASIFPSRERHATTYRHVFQRITAGDRQLPPRRRAGRARRPRGHPRRRGSTTTCLMRGRDGLRSLLSSGPT